MSWENEFSPYMNDKRTDASSSRQTYSPIYEPHSPTAIDPNYQPQSPLYEPSSPAHHPEYEPMAFSSHDKASTYTRESTSRKRIYGEEFKEPTILTVYPQSKILKLENPIHEEIGSDNLKLRAAPSPNTLQKRPYPTETPRNFNSISINVCDIPRLCECCYSVKCICYIYKK